MKLFGRYDDLMDGYDSDDVTPAPYNPVSDFIEPVVNDPQPESQSGQAMSQVEKRLELATYYRLLMNGSLFNDDSDSAREVEEEIRRFVQARLETLVGLRTPKQPQPDQFTPEEVVVLKALAGRVLQRPSLVAAKPSEPKPAPALKTFSPKEKPTPTLATFEPPKRKPGRPRKTPESSKPVAPVPQKVEPEVISSDEPVKKTVDGKRKFKRVTAPDGTPFDIEVTEQAVSKTAPPIPQPGKAQLEMVMQQQAQQAAAAFAPSAMVAATLTANSNGDTNGQ